MPSSPWTLPVVLSAACLAGATWILAVSWPRRPTLEEWLQRRNSRRTTSRRPAQVGRWALVSASVMRLSSAVQRQIPQPLRATLSGSLSRAGIGAPVEVVVAVALILTTALASVMLTLTLQGLAPPGLSVLAVLALPLGVLTRVVGLGSRRRRAIGDQLPILVDLMALEQGGGGIGARSAMELVVSRLDGDAAQLLRSCLAASATAGTPQLDRQLEDAARHLDIPSLSALAAVVRVQREEGVATSLPLGLLARGLRDRQRDELLARGRKALVTMLLPVGICILLPFVVIILYPALTRLATAFS